MKSNRGLTQEGHKGHEDKSFEQELTEATEDNPDMIAW